MQQLSNEKSVNYNGVDVLKLLLCIFIVFIHTGFLGRLIYPFVRVAVPAFFIISGIFAFRKIDSVDDSEKGTVLKRIITRYLKLYLFWFIVNLPYTLYIRNYFEHGIISGFVLIFKSFFLGSTFPASWYIMASVISICVVYELSRKLDNNKILLITIPFYIYATFSCEFSLLIPKINIISSVIPFMNNLFGEPQFNFCIALVYITIGKIISDSITGLKNKFLYMWGAIFSLVLLFLEYGYISTKSFFIFNNDCLFMLLPVAVFVVLIALNVNIPLRSGKTIRKLTTIIFCSHIAAASVIAKVMDIIGINDFHNVILFVLTFSVCSIGGIVLMKLSEYKYFKWLKYSY